jgi:hypothetical protein
MKHKKELPGSTDPRFWHTLSDAEWQQFFDSNGILEGELLERFCRIMEINSHPKSLQILIWAPNVMTKSNDGRKKRQKKHKV